MDNENSDYQHPFNDDTSQDDQINMMTGLHHCLEEAEQTPP